MKKAANASLLALSAIAFVPAALPLHAQAPAQSGAVQMDPAEFAVYDNALNKVPANTAAQAAAFEDYLTKFPKSAVKADVLNRIMIDYSAVDPAKAIVAADNVLQLSPNNMQAYVIEVAYREDAAKKMTADPAAMQSGLDAAAGFAQKGLAASKPEGMAESDFNNLKAYGTPTFYRVLAEDANGKKDYATAITDYKAELAAVKPDQTSAPSVLQDTYFLGAAYQLSAPPDYINCTFYTTRAAALAPDQFKPVLQPLANYCYKKYHGGMDGYDAVVALAKANVNPPADFKITPAPTDEDQVTKLMASTPEADLPKLALSDKEYILQYGKTADAEKVFDTIKGKTVEIPDATVIEGTTDQVKVAVSDDAVQSKTADFTFNMKTPLKAAPTTGSKITLTGTYTSYTQKPVIIVMSDAEEVSKKAPAKTPTKAPAHKAPARRR